MLAEPGVCLVHERNLISKFGTRNLSVDNRSIGDLERFVDDPKGFA